MTVRWRDVLLQLCPPWLRGTFGQNLMAATAGLWADLSSDATIVATSMPWLLHENNPDDSLELIGEESRLPRYPNESTANYRIRLHNRWHAYAEGKEQTLIEQLRLYGFTPTLATVANRLYDWTFVRCSRASATGPGGSTDCVRITEDSSNNTHHFISSASGVPTNKMVEVRFLARCDATRPWLRLDLGYSGDYVYLNVGTREIGATSAPGGTGTVRGYKDEWCVVRLRFWSQAASQQLLFYMADADESNSYQGDGASWIEIADLTVGTPEPIVVRDNENAAPDRTNWWSQFWMVVCEGTHPFTGSIPAGDEVAIKGLIRKWKPGIWSTTKAVFITSGSVPVLMGGLGADDWAALLLPDDHTALEIAF